MIPSRWNYILAFTAIPFAVLDIYLGLYGFAILWTIGGVMHTLSGMRKDKENANPRD